VSSEAARAVQWAQARHIWDVGRQRIPQAARAFCGPARGACAVCGLEIGGYESRRYGADGAVHVWKPGALAELATCLNRSNEHRYPYFYTDG
jgi:hypothetical protein